MSNAEYEKKTFSLKFIRKSHENTIHNKVSLFNTKVINSNIQKLKESINLTKNFFENYDQEKFYSRREKLESILTNQYDLFKTFKKNSIVEKSTDKQIENSFNSIKSFGKNKNTRFITSLDNSTMHDAYIIPSDMIHSNKPKNKSRNNNDISVVLNNSNIMSILEKSHDKLLDIKGKNIRSPLEDSKFFENKNSSQNIKKIDHDNIQNYIEKHRIKKISERSIIEKHSKKHSNNFSISDSEFKMIEGDILKKLDINLMENRIITNAENVKNLADNFTSNNSKAEKRLKSKQIKKNLFEKDFIYINNNDKIDQENRFNQLNFNTDGDYKKGEPQIVEKLKNNINLNAINITYPLKKFQSNSFHNEKLKNTKNSSVLCQLNITNRDLNTNLNSIGKKGIYQNMTTSTNNFTNYNSCDLTLPSSNLFSSYKKKKEIKFNENKELKASKNNIFIYENYTPIEKLNEKSKENDKKYVEKDSSISNMNINLYLNRNDGNNTNKKNFDNYQIENSYFLNKELKNRSNLQSIKPNKSVKSIDPGQYPKMKIHDRISLISKGVLKEAYPLETEKLFSKVFNKNLENILEMKKYPIRASTNEKINIHDERKEFGKKNYISKEITDLKEKVYFLKGTLDYIFPQFLLGKLKETVKNKTYLRQNGVDSPKDDQQNLTEKKLDLVNQPSEDISAEKLFFFKQEDKSKGDSIFPNIIIYDKNTTLNNELYKTREEGINRTRLKSINIKNTKTKLISYDTNSSLFNRLKNYKNINNKNNTNDVFWNNTLNESSLKFKNREFKKKMLAETICIQNYDLINQDF